VRLLLDAAGEKDPVRAITLKARELALSAMDRGWGGPPFDPLRLADLLGILVSPRHDLRDARTLPVSGGKTLIEFNPNRSRAGVVFVSKLWAYLRTPVLAFRAWSAC